MGQRILLGMVVRDSVTGFEGVARSRCEYLYDSPSVHVVRQSLGADGKPVDEWFTEERLTVVAQSYTEQ